MSRKATNRVTTIGIDIGKNTFHLIGFDARPRRLRVNKRHFHGIRSLKDCLRGHTL